MTRTALLVVDVQQGLDEPLFGARNNPEAEHNIARLLAAWRAAAAPLAHVQHMSVRPDSPLRPGVPGNAIKPEAAPLPGEPHFTKSANSAFIGTALDAHFRDAGIGDIVIVGLVTDHCISTTARMAANLGYRVTVVSDATATHERTGHDGTQYSAETMHGVELASLHGEFAVIASTDEVLLGMAG